MLHVVWSAAGRQPNPTQARAFWLSFFQLPCFVWATESFILLLPAIGYMFLFFTLNLLRTGNVLFLTESDGTYPKYLPTR